MAYMNPQQWRDSLIGIGQGRRATVFEDPNEIDPNEILKFTGPALDRGGAPGRPNFAGSRAASGTYGPVPVQQASTGTALTPFQKGLEGAGEAIRNFGQQQQGFVEDRPQAPPMSEQPSGGMTLPMGPAGLSGGSDDPQGMMSKIGNFFTRTPGMGQTLSALGAGIAAESSQPGGSFWTGLARGSDAAMEAEQRRHLIEQQQQEIDRTRTQEDEDRAAQKEVNDKIRELREGWDDTTTAEQMAADTREAGMIAFSNNNSPLGRGLIELARDFIEDPEAGSSTSITNFDQIRYRAPDGTPARGRKRTVTQANGDLEQIFEYVDEDVLKENLDEGMSAADAQINSWRVGGYMADPAEELRLREEEEEEAGQRDMSGKMAYAARDANRSFVIDQDTGERVNLDFVMAGAVPILWDEEGNAIDWEKGEIDDLQFWQSFFGDVIANAGSETVGFGKKLFNSIVRTKLPTKLLQSYTEALNFINPTVRFLSGAQMTNQEAMRYYNALLPMTGDSVENVRKKRRKRDVLTAAMGGEGITDAQVREAREFLGIDPDMEMNHLFSQFGREDETGSMAMNYYLAILADKIGATNTFTSAQMREIRATGRAASGTLGDDFNIGDTPP